MSTLTDSPEFTANEAYEIQATDPLEGAAAGASYGGSVSPTSRISSSRIAPRT